MDTPNEIVAEKSTGGVGVPIYVERCQIVYLSWDVSNIVS